MVKSFFYIPESLYNIVPMKSLTEKLTDTILFEETKTPSDKELKDLGDFVRKMKEYGIIKTPQYTLPLVDTIGKIYYLSIHKS